MHTVPRLLSVACFVATVSGCVADVGSDAAGPSSHDRPLEGIPPAGRVTPILLVPDGLALHPSDADNFARALEWIQGWFGTELGGRTFRTTPVEVVHSSHDLKWFQCANRDGCTDSTDWGNVHAALREAGYPLFERNTVHLVLMRGAGGFAGGVKEGPNVDGHVEGDGGGFALLGDIALEGLRGHCRGGEFEPFCGDDPVRMQTGAIAHELGHALGLPHPPETETTPRLMGGWWDFPDANLGARDRQTLRANPILVDECEILRRDFPATGQRLCGRMLRFWEKNGGVAVFGFPIGPEQFGESGGRPNSVQWFERTRLERHSDIEPPYDVLLGQVGRERMADLGIAPPSREAGPSPGCAWFEATGHNVCNQSSTEGFRAYWSSHGLDDPELGPYERSVALFGYPLTEARVEVSADGEELVTQWFERARFEWHAANPPGSRVLLGLLGNELR